MFATGEAKENRLERVTLFFFGKFNVVIELTIEIPIFEMLLSMRGPGKIYLLILTAVDGLPLLSEASCYPGIPIVSVTCDFFVFVDKQNRARIANRPVDREPCLSQLFCKHSFLNSIIQIATNSL